MVLYEFLYTGLGQFIAAYAPNPVFASLINPVVITVLVLYCTLAGMSSFIVADAVTQAVFSFHPCKSPPIGEIGYT